MSLLHESGYDDQQLVRYLLQLLPEHEAEQLDEMSISDDEVAGRLRVVENDLVDAYVRGTLPVQMLDQFESSYLSSERRRQKVTFAANFLRVVDRGVGPVVAQPQSALGDFRPASRTEPRASAVWILAAAAALFLVAGGALLVRDAGLRNGLNQAQNETAALNRRAHELEQQLNDQRAANTETTKELGRVRASIAALAQQSAAARPPDRTPAPSPALATTALVLLPQTRGVGPIATLAVPSGTESVAFELRFESNHFLRYQVAVKDPATNETVWRSGPLAAKSPADQPAVSVVVPASRLKPQHYSLELTGYTEAETAQVVGTYAVRFVP